MPLDPRRGELVVVLHPAVRHDLVEGAPPAGGDGREPGVVGRLLAVGRRDVVSEPAPELGEDPPRRTPVPDRFDDRRCVLRGDAWHEEVPQRDVGALELVLRREHVRRQCGRVVGDDLDRRQHVERSERRHEVVGVRERGDEMTAEVQHGPDVPGPDLVGEHRARPLAEERL